MLRLLPRILSCALPAALLAACVQPTTINGLHTSFFDTAQFSFASIRIRGLPAVVKRQIILGALPQDQTETDTTYSILQFHDDSLLSLSSKFLNDTLTLRDHVVGERDSVQWRVQCVLDSSHTHFLSVMYWMNYSRWDKIFDMWYGFQNDNFFNMPIQYSSGGIVTGKGGLGTRTLCQWDTANRSDGNFSCAQIDSVVTSQDSAALPGQIEIILSP